MTRNNRPFVNDYRPSRYQSMFGEQRGGQYRVLCADGKVRTATATNEADSMATIPARVNVNGRTVTGHVFMRSTFDYSKPGWPEWDDTTPLYRFSPDTWRKNADALPEWPPTSKDYGA